ncbi:MAG: transporter substrate-binding domain-containing protein [Ruminococcaceae bacterium]|nr:transporter substrate-binding domain-containing protein [Oscillospiraceae bacterium]
MKKVISTLLLLAMLLTVAVLFSSCGKETLVVYTEAGFAPFEYVSDGEIVGVDVDIMELVGEKLNKKVVFENVAFDTIVDTVAAGTLTNVGAAGISVTPARKEKVDFSKEYYTAELYVIYKASEVSSYESTTTDNVTGIYWDSLAGKNIAVQDGTTADLFLGDELAEGGTIYNTDAKKTGFASLASAVADIGLNVDVLIIDELPAKKLIEGKSDLKCAPLYYKGADGEDDEAAVDTYAICVTKGQDELLDAINEVLDELGKDGIQKLVNKHLGIEE